MSLTVRTPAPRTSFLTVDQIRRVLTVPDRDTAAVEALIVDASHTISDICHRVFALEQVEETGEDLGHGILLTRVPIRAVQRVVCEGMIMPEYEVLDADAGLLGAPRGWSDNGWGRSALGYRPQPHVHTATRALSVTYTGGYIVPGWGCPATLPAALQMACADTVLAWYREGTKGPVPQRAYSRLLPWIRGGVHAAG